jgi:hypothetical protein
MTLCDIHLSAYRASRNFQFSGVAECVERGTLNAIIIDCASGFVFFVFFCFFLFIRLLVGKG